MVGVALATFAVSWAWHRNPQGSSQRERPLADVTTILTGPAGIPATVDRSPAAGPGMARSQEPLPDWDTTDLMQESMTVDELLVEANADSGEGFTPVDRERLAELLRSDPELRKAVGN
jgi:hypothetical protein